MATREDILIEVYSRVLYRAQDDHGRRRLEPEIVNHILDYLGVLGPVNPSTITAAPAVVVSGANDWYSHPALKPPLNGACFFMQLPAELRRIIFARELAGRDVVYEPKCQVHDNRNENNFLTGDAEDGEEKPEPKRNRASDLMTINKTICWEVATVMYEERKFIVHIHEGIKYGGVEFLHAGRQKLQYQDDITSDTRFEKFRSGEAFGFDRIKKLKVIIFPPALNEPASRHTHVNTYFMVQALCQLLQRSEEKNKLIELTIEFKRAEVDTTGLTGRRAIAAAENYLWDALRKEPSTTSIHNLHDFEIILRPFSILRSHRVIIHPPHQFKEHPKSRNFSQRLRDKMLSSTDNVGAEDAEFVDDRSGAQIRALGPDLQRSVFETLYGIGKGIEVESLGDSDIWAEKTGSTVKHSISPIKGPAGKRRKSGEFFDEDEEEDMSAVGLLERYQGGILEESMLEEQRALLASMDRRRESGGSPDARRGRLQAIKRRMAGLDADTETIDLSNDEPVYTTQPNRVDQEVHGRPVWLNAVGTGLSRAVGRSRMSTGGLTPSEERSGWYVGPQRSSSNAGTAQSGRLAMDLTEDHAQDASGSRVETVDLTN